MSDREFQILDGKQFTSLSFELGLKVVEGGFPEVLVAVWRGGLFPAFCIDEMCRTRGARTEVVGVLCQRYRGIGDGTESPRVIPLQDLPLDPARIVIVDDIIDEGRTAQAVEAWVRHERSGAEVEVATVAYNPSRHRFGRPPDYYAIEVENWVVFPHELEDLPLELRRLKEPVLKNFWDAQ